MKLKLSLLIVLIFSFTSLHAINVIVAKKSIKYKEKIDVKKLAFKQVKKINKKCTPITLNYLNSQEFSAAHHINRNSIICESSLRVYKKDSIVFDFGTIEIEKNGKLVRESDEYIMIKNENGKRDKIFKDGRVK